MSATTLTRIELHPEGIFSNRCEIRRDGVVIGRTGKLYSPLTTGFELEGRQWRVHTHLPGGNGFGVLRALVSGVLARGGHVLSVDGGEPVALATGRGFFDQGCDLMLGDQPARLDTDRKISRFSYSGPGGEGYCEKLGGGKRGMVAVLPGTLEAPHQVFIALLAIRWWIRLSSSG